MNELPSPSKSVINQIIQLPDLEMDELKALWKQVFKKEPPTHIRKTLEKRLAHQLQINALKTKQEGAKLIKRNQKRISQLTKSQQATPTEVSHIPLPGTILKRQYQDREYQVTVLPDGQFEFQGQTYTSLSPIAREITGTRWSGPLFFGLKQNTRKRQKTTKK